jgi:hypothetical protein
VSKDILGMSKLHQLPVVNQTSSFDLFRLSKSKEAVDLCSNTLRQYFKDGLPFYKMGKAIFISRAQLAQFITTKGMAQRAN